MITFVLLPLLALMTMRLQTAAPPSPASPIVRSEFIFERAPFPSAHASTIVETPDGLVAAWFGGTKERDPDVGIWVSRREGGGWSAPVEVANGVQPDGTRYPCWNPVLFQPSRGPLVLFYKVGPSPSEWWGMVRTSADAGRTWSAATKLPAGILGPIRAKPIELGPDMVLAGSSTEHDGWVVHMERFTGSWAPESLGSPSSWEKTGGLNDAKEFGAIQPTILVHSPSSIEILCRSRQGVITQAWSEDAGRTWGRMTATALPNPSAGIDAVRLSDGRFLLVYNPSATSRGKLELAMSTDGKAWSSVAVLEDAAGEYSYPAMIQARDGAVHVTYTWKRERIKHVVLDPTRFGSTSQTASSNLGSDANGNPLRRASKTGHVSNYDESKVRPYTLPDPLVMANGVPVRDPATWMKTRRPEIIRIYERDIYGRTPSKTPKVKWQVAGTDTGAREGTAVKKRIVGTIGDAADAPRVNLTLYTPSNVKMPVPVILLVNFGGGTATPAANAPPGDPPVAADIIARGWGYAMVVYQDIQPDRNNAFNQGVIGATLPSGQQQPGAEEWGTIGAWAWGVSRIIDFLETDKTVNARQIAVFGHSRLGKTALWASALDERIAAVYASCSGEMGAALARRDWGETVDDMAQTFPYWFAGNFQQWAGRWNDMPVDAHMLIALSAPRPVFVTGGTKDQWADPKGMFLAEVAAGPVYRLLGKEDLGVTELPPLDTPIISGELGWHYHTGGHAATPEDWKAFLQFLGKYFQSKESK
jgi:predicted neuraminidase